MVSPAGAGKTTLLRYVGRRSDGRGGVFLGTKGDESGRKPGVSRGWRFSMGHDAFPPEWRSERWRGVGIRRYAFPNMALDGSDREPLRAVCDAGVCGAKLLTAAGVGRAEAFATTRSEGHIQHPPAVRILWRVFATGRASRVTSLPAFHTCRRHYPGGNGPVLASLGSRPLAAIPEPDSVGRSG